MMGAGVSRQGHADRAVLAHDVDPPGGDPLVIDGLDAGLGRLVEDHAFQRLQRGPGRRRLGDGGARGQQSGEENAAGDG